MDFENDEQYKDQSIQTDDYDELQSLKDKISALTAKIHCLEAQMNDLNSKPKFEISDHKDSDEDIVFYTGFPNYETLELCFDLLKEKAAHLCYKNRDETEFPTNYKKPGSKRKLTIWQEFTMVVVRLRLGLFKKDIAERFRASVSTVSVI
ncbi:uncharacterized protein LOC114574157 [Exaiptasia diaphana]|uniref:Transposase Helix-turn-helix domain-containing protein n=1 Tax=Exaiptasia diaphana TaxID=2652724 RepID=A0A913YQ21_EXADI|nr:uncharacterized protein LOC114574157 [Exaiptasia diaphana]